MDNNDVYDDIMIIMPLLVVEIHVEPLPPKYEHGRMPRRSILEHRNLHKPTFPTFVNSLQRPVFQMDISVTVIIHVLFCQAIVRMTAYHEQEWRCKVASISGATSRL